MILVDTSVWVDYLNTHPSDEAAYLTLCIAEGRELVIPGLVLTEILLGARSDVEAARITRVMSAFDLAPELERADYEQAARLHRACRARGMTPRSTAECLIAGLCLKHDYELLARDRDFQAIAQVSPLRLAIPSSSVQERAARYGSPEVLRRLGGKVHATPGESVLQDEDCSPARSGSALTRRRAPALRRSSPASAARRPASRR
ncbi:MAG: PIN domain nuclease [Gammaproteobacteria bacterium]|nr:PIN domain nuclease [Gammaproteobacteria bacterium]